MSMTPGMLTNDPFPGWVKRTCGVALFIVALAFAAWNVQYLERGHGSSLIFRSFGLAALSLLVAVLLVAGRKTAPFIFYALSAYGVGVFVEDLIRFKHDYSQGWAVISHDVLWVVLPLVLLWRFHRHRKRVQTELERLQKLISTPESTGQQHGDGN
ncbi:MAG: hypothetical protein WCD43_15085 [Candidatus Acidiferrales bacterium]